MHAILIENSNIYCKGPLQLKKKILAILGMVVSRILKANIPVQNGIVHLIDKPLMVVARSLYDYLMEEGMDPENREEDNEIHEHTSSINLKSKFL